MAHPSLLPCRVLTPRLLTSLVFVLFAVAAPLKAQTPANDSLPAPVFDLTSIFDLTPVFDLTPDIDADQVPGQPAGPPPTPRHTGVKALAKGLVTDAKHLPSRTNLFWVGVGSGAAAAAHPFDDNIHQYYVDNPDAGKFFKPGAVLGQLPTLLSAAVIVYAVGRIKDEPKVSHVGMDLIQALVISEGITELLKYTTRRERPDGSGKNSFPSGHAADTFAFATALERHLGWKGAVPAYIFSSYVAISRLPADRHWLSDAVFGTAVGIIAGRTVTRHAREEFPVEIAFVPGGAAVMFVRRGNGEH